MPRTFRQVMETFPSDIRKKIDRRVYEINQELTLQQLQNALGLTRSEFKHKLDEASQQDVKSDIQFNALFKVMQTMGGNLEIIAHFPKRDPLCITNILSTS